MFICDENINTGFTNKKHVELALKKVQTAFPDFPSNTYLQGKIDKLQKNSSTCPRLEIIEEVIEVIGEVERQSEDSTPFVELFNILSVTFGYRFEINATYPNMLTCYNFTRSNTWEEISVPVTKIKYIKQHDHTLVNVNHQNLTRSRVSCVNDAGEEFRIYKNSGVYLCLQSDLVYQSAVSFLNQAIAASQ
ncbi:hypothetical protein D2B47_23330 [Salmonella enterica]|uniref:hypothetical protein n=1 Tax=Klebsiella pneumoniae TaxID=573 RepID=UPI0010343DAD|nr:hypothetical protein [Klebsiella pneumoniae]EBJ5156694.1 hypothetical protein [Salmonella enterica]EDK3498916.1 hypothetical protein [Salmonella enterica subsp. enterica serovar Newport]EET1434502.1 hypothetical protein [Escherichia coli]EBM6019394.1 hypothetical protein [Salmonella enterica]EFM5365775.1 hypothetical protein [Escherichia coli]